MKTTHKIGILSLTILGMNSYTSYAKSVHQQAQKTNVLFLVIEDTSPYLFPAYGNKTVKTPNLDKIAQKGVVFTNAFSSAPYCSATRSSLLPGSLATKYGNDYHREAHCVPEQYFFPIQLQKAGYFTVNSGKTDYNVIGKQLKMYMPKMWSAFSGPGKKGTATYNDPKRELGQPFFGQFNNASTHMSRMTTGTLENRLPCRIDPNKVQLPSQVPDTPEMRADYAMHLEGVEDIDQWVGLFVQDLKERGEWDNTAVFFFADHGGCLPRGKAFPYDTGVRIPLIVHLPENMKKQLNIDSTTHECNRLVNMEDFAPTVLSIAQIKPPKYMNGKAFLGKYQTKARDHVNTFRCNTDIHYDPSRSVTDGRFQYIRYFTPYKIHALRQKFQWGMPSQQSWDKLYSSNQCDSLHTQYYEPHPTEQLFDLKEDPWELHNLATHPNYKHKLEQMQQEMKEYLKQNEDIGFLPPSVRRDLTGSEIALYDYAHKRGYSIPFLQKVALECSSTENENEIKKLSQWSESPLPEIRFWCAVACAKLAKEHKLIENIDIARKLSSDNNPDVSITAAEALMYYGETQPALEILKTHVENGHLEALSALEELKDLTKPLIPYLEIQAQKEVESVKTFYIRSVLIQLEALDYSELYTPKQLSNYYRGHVSRKKGYLNNPPNPIVNKALSTHK